MSVYKLSCDSVAISLLNLRKKILFLLSETHFGLPKKKQYYQNIKILSVIWNFWYRIEIFGLLQYGKIILILNLIFIIRNLV